ncbi:MAG: lysostaphin resistance A-like protein [Bacteroidota bacterium]
MDWFANSRLFELARTGRRVTPIWAAIPLAFVFSYAAQFGALPVLVAVVILYGTSGTPLPLDRMSATEAGFWMAAFLISAFALVYVLTGAWVLLYEKRPFRTLGYERGGSLKRYARGFLLGIVIFGVAAGILAAAGAVAIEKGDPSKQGTAAIAGVLLVLAGWVVQGGAEELVTRGWALPVIAVRSRPWLGLALSSLLFAAMHSLNENLSALALVNLALFGIFAGLYAMREGSLWGISALHAAWNWAEGNLFGFEVSGMQAGGGALWNLTGTGPDWLTGGMFGPEGGAAVSAALLIGIAVVLWGRRGASKQILGSNR